MSSPILLCMGNPLLDISCAENGEAILAKYGLKPNDAVLATPEQFPIFEDLQKNHKVVYLAGGAAQNAARGAQYVLPAGSTAYLGAVGTDDLANQLRVANEKEGLQDAYQIVESKPTGACAVIITGHDRSLCTELGAAEAFEPAHLETAAVKALIVGAKFYYLGGFFLTHGLVSAKILAQHSHDNKKIFSMNLSAPFIPQFFKSQVDELLPFVDILIGNESEAEAYAESHEYGTKDIAEIALKLAASPKNSATPRIVIITQGASSTIVATAGATKVHPVSALASADIIDTNGAGDAFAGGFIGAYVSGKTLDQSVEVGHRMGQMCVGQVGPQFKFPKVDVLAGI